MSSEQQSMSLATIVQPSLQTQWNSLSPFPRMDVLQLIEEAVEGSWIGHRARLFTQQQESEIGSLYAPPRQDGNGKKLVEIVIEIGDREEVSLTVRVPSSSPSANLWALTAQSRGGFSSSRKEVSEEY